MQQLTWKWERASRAYGNYGNANQWTVNAGMASLARESAQNTNDARGANPQAELVYTFIRLTGDRKKAFQEAASWPVLFEHLGAMAANAEAAVTAGQIKAGVAAMDGTDDLVLLQIADYGCRGLTGPEFHEGPTEDYGNFIKLCRLDLFSGKDEAAGGSFGLGKAVYWRFSRLQTVLFNSSLADIDAVGGNTTNRVFGVNAGVIHEAGNESFQGRGYFGQLTGDDISSTWTDDETVERLHLYRPDTRPGTTALLLGFYDPDEPEGGTSSGDALIKAARRLRAGIEESFWPLLTRGRLKVSIRVEDDGQQLLDEVINPGDTYTELVRAIGMFDRGEIDETLEEDESIVVRDIPITISARRDGINDHEAFEHTAKLIVTMSDAQEDSLENNVCLFRKPEMVVQTLPREFEGRTYHAFLLAGASIKPEHPSNEDLLADDFLRFAEPPAHDRWIPGSGRNQASQANLTARYVAPWVPNLRNIEKSVVEALYELFGTPPPTDSKGPESILRNLKFLRGEPDGGGTGNSAGRKPEITLTDWEVVDGAWDVTFEITARNRQEGWSVTPQLKFVGLDGTGRSILWDKLEVISGAMVVDGNVVIPPKDRGRKVQAVVRGRSTTKLPIPAAEAAIDVVVGSVSKAEDNAEKESPE